MSPYQEEEVSARVAANQKSAEAYRKWQGMKRAFNAGSPIVNELDVLRAERDYLKAEIDRIKLPGLGGKIPVTTDDAVRGLRKRIRELEKRIDELEYLEETK